MKNLSLKMIFFVGFILLIMAASLKAQNSSIAVINIPSVGLEFGSAASEEVTSMARIALEKLQKFQVIDKYEVKEHVAKEGVKDIDICNGQTCQLRIAKSIGVDNLLMGEIEQFENKIVVSFRLLDVKTNEIKKHQLLEFVEMPVELSKMIDIAIKDLLEVEYDKKLKAILLYVESTEDIVVSDVRNSGTRMGIGIATGMLSRRIKDSRATGGREGSPVMSQMGYQFEKQYLNAGEFHAVAEMLIMVSGIEQQMFAPSLVFMNGFRLSKSGWEFGFGPNFRIVPTSMGFYDETGEFGDKGTYWTEREFRNFYNETPVSEDKIPTYKKHMDSRGSLSIRTGWVWSVGKTFKSGYLNIPINVYVAPSQDGWTYGASFGFNIRKAKKE